MKYKLINMLDTAGLGVLAPLVLLAYGEEPHVQLRKIGLYLVMPILFFIVFLQAWGYLAPRHTTKSGQVPTPGVVLDAAYGVKRFHDWEYTKQDDYYADGQARDVAIEDVKARTAALAPMAAEANAAFAAAQATFEAATQARVAPLKAKYDDLKASYRTAQKQRKAELTMAGAEVPVGDAAAREAYLRDVKVHMAQTARERYELKALKGEMEALRGQLPADLISARNAKNRIGEEQQYLKKRLEVLTTANRANKAAAAKARLVTEQENFLQSAGQSVYLSATKVIKAEERIGRISNASYAKPYTLIDQIKISLACVFTGFVIATIIAIPIGVLCGLSSIFMACMTPLISLFKPVSPIVWLPIVFIIVGGFIDNPADAMVHPAFLSSAVTVALCSLWPTLVNTALGVAAIDKDHLNVARVLRLGFWARLFKIVIPSALPLIFAGLRISLGVGWMVLVAAELLSSSEGIGKFVWDMFNNGSSQTFAQMFVVVFVVGFVGLMLDRIMIVLQRCVSFDEAPTAI